MIRLFYALLRFCRLAGWLVGWLVNPQILRCLLFAIIFHFVVPVIIPAQWVDFTLATDQWLSNSIDVEEKDIVTADFNRDGWEDIVVVRRETFSVAGARADLLLLNNGTTLEDRTADYAPEFLTNPTDSRDVIVGDLDGDNWPDIVIASTFEDQPVFYHNLGLDSLGNWLGFLDESEDRFPLPLNVFPLQFCAVWAGDVNGDGALDIYFNNYGVNAGQGGAEDVLLINDGTGHFVDESADRLGILRNSAFGTSVEMHDMDNDGDLDILKISTLFAYPPWNENGLFLLFNDGTGHFTNWQKVPSQAPYMFSVADINHDGLLDIYVVDDDQDYINMGFEITPDQNINFLGQLVNDARIMFFGGNVKFGDLDNDGFLDVGVADVDIDIPPCESGGGLRKFTMMQNNGTGLTAVYGNNYYPWNESTYDFAFVDLNNDCNLDVFIGRCESYAVFINDGNLDMFELAIEGEDIFCDNAATTLDAGAGFSSYLWPDSTTAQTLAVDTSGLYCVTVTDITGCVRVACKEVEAVAAFETILEASICDGQSYELAGQVFDQPGDYQIDLTSTSGCDSVLFLSLQVQDVSEENVVATICQGESYLIGATAYEESGVYFQILTTPNGCDSIVNLDLTVIPNIISDELVVATICQGEVFGLGDMNFINAGSYQVAFPAANGCDSLVNLELIVNPSDFTVLTEAICEGEAYELGDDVFTESGLYQATFDNQYGCDSLVQVNLFVLESTQTEVSYNLCEGESVEIDGMIIDQEGIFDYMLVDQNGCDSAIVLTVSLSPVTNTALSASICESESYTVGTSVYTETGFYSDTLNTALGCDSIIALDLTVFETPVTILIDSLCAGESIAIGDMVFTETGIFEALLISEETGCDSLIALDLTVGTELWIVDTTIMADNGTSSGSIQVLASGGIGPYTYLWSNGATTATITGLTSAEYSLTITDAAHCSAIFSFMVDLNSATAGTFDSGLVVYAFPNPFSESVRIGLENGPFGQKSIEVLNVNGQQLLLKTFESDSINLTLDAPPGVYWFRIWQVGEMLGKGRLVLVK